MNRLFTAKFIPYEMPESKGLCGCNQLWYALRMNDQFSLFDPVPSKSKETNILYFDLETMRGADEVGGWSNIKKMGMACGVCFETSTKKFHVFEENQVADLINLLRSADLIVGFNHIRFDYEVLRGYNSFDLVCFFLLP